ncbi:hypothetical protein MRX96_054302 [Rhipicephalus microplus]
MKSYSPCIEIRCNLFTLWWTANRKTGIAVSQQLWRWASHSSNSPIALLLVSLKLKDYLIWKFFTKSKEASGDLNATCALKVSNAVSI